MWGLGLTSDGGYVIGGTNGINDEDYFMVKVAPDCQPNIAFTGTSDIVSGHSLTSNETWSTNRQVKGTIDIPSGKTLTINNGATIKFADSWRTLDYDYLAQNNFSSGPTPTKIVVEQGGKLIINNATLRGMNACGGADGDMWQGTEVWGDPSHYQASYQGTVTMQNSAKIQDARCGILVEKGYYNVNGNLWGNDLFGGGIVSSTDGIISNCRFGVAFGPNQTNSYPNYFKRTTFECTAPLVDDIYMDVDGNRLGTGAFCKLYNTKRVYFNGSNFNGNSSFTNPKYRGIGIASYDANYTVQDDAITTTHCKFNNLYQGITSGATSNSVHSILIKDAEFGMDHSSNPTGENVQAIYFSGMGIGNTVRNNYIKVPQLSQSNLYPFGIQYDGCTSFSCYDNKLNGDGTGGENWGIIVASSGGNDNIVYRNTLEDFKHSTTALFNNATSNRGNGLQFKCNEYKNSSAYFGNIEDLSFSILHPLNPVSPGSIRLNQGYCSTSSTNSDYYTAPAGNTFSNGCFLWSRIFLDNPALNIAYNFNNIDPIPMYDPGLPNICTSPITQVLAQTCGIFYNGQDPCPEPGVICSNCSTVVMQQMDAQISGMKSLVDGGDTQAMLDFLGYGGATPQEAITELEEPGPYLSDEVLLAAIEHADEIGNSGLKDVIIKNSPLSYSVYESLLFLKPVIAGNAAVINAQLAQQSPREALELQIGQLQGEKRQMALQLIEYYLTNDTTPQTDSATMLLAAAGYDMDAAGMLAFAGNLADASTLLEGTQPASQEELDEKNMMRISLSLSGENKSISQEQLDLVTDLAEGISPASTQAKNVLHLLNQTDLVPEIPDYYRGLSAARLSSPKDRFIITNYYTFDEVLLSVSPNPASTESTVSYQFAASVTKPLVRVSDINGKQFILKTIDQYANSKLIETSDLTPGVYYVQLMDGASLLKSVPLVIIK